MKKTLSTIFISFLAFGAFAQQKVLFKLAPENNKPIKYEVINKMDVDGPQTLIMDMQMHLDLTFSEANDTLLNVTGKYTYAKMDLDAGMMAASFDSSKEPQTDMEKAFSAQFMPLLENTLTYTMNKSGKVLDVDFPNVSEQIFDKSSINSMGVTYPAHPIAVGESWTSESGMEQLGVTAKAKYTVLEKAAEGYKIDSDVVLEDATGNSVGTVKGYFIVHPKTFVTVASSTETSLSMQGATIKSTNDLKIIQ